MKESQASKEVLSDGASISEVALVPGLPLENESHTLLKWSENHYVLRWILPSARFFRHGSGLVVLDELSAIWVKLMDREKYFFHSYELESYLEIDQCFIFYSDAGILIHKPFGATCINFTKIFAYITYIDFSKISGGVVEFTLGTGGIVTKTIDALEGEFGEEVRPDTALLVSSWVPDRDYLSVEVI